MQLMAFSLCTFKTKNFHAETFSASQTKAESILVEMKSSEHQTEKPKKLSMNLKKMNSIVIKNIEKNKDNKLEILFSKKIFV